MGSEVADKHMCTYLSNLLSNEPPNCQMNEPTMSKLEQQMGVKNIASQWDEGMGKLQDRYRYEYIYQRT